MDIRKYKGGCGVDIILRHKNIAEMGGIRVDDNQEIEGNKEIWGKI